MPIRNVSTSTESLTMYVFCGNKCHDNSRCGAFFNLKVLNPVVQSIVNELLSGQNVNCSSKYNMNSQVFLLKKKECV